MLHIPPSSGIQGITMLLRGILLVACLGLAAASLDSLLADSIDSCWGLQPEACLRGKVADYIGAPRSGGESALAQRVSELLATHDVRVELPEVFQDANLVFRPGKGLDFDIEFPEENDVAPRGARDMMKQKMLFPVLMMVKMMLKAVVPILLGMVSLKATKALILSKIAILLVVGFLVVQLCQKLGMAKMSMQPAMPPMDSTPPPPIYGPPTSPSSYDPSSWEPAPGPYARISYDTAQNMAYSSYAPSSQQPSNRYK